MTENQSVSDQGHADGLDLPYVFTPDDRPKTGTSPADLKLQAC